MPVLMIATYGEDGTPNVMNAAWGGITLEDEITICIDTSHKTWANIAAKKAFTVAFGTVETASRCDYLGIVSGNQTPDKVAKSGFTLVKSGFVDAPVINELPLCLECEFVEYQGSEYGCGVIGKVVNVTADARVMVNGKIDMSLVNAIAFDPYTHGYYKVTERVGEAFKDGLKLKK